MRRDDEAFFDCFPTRGQVEPSTSARRVIKAAVRSVPEAKNARNQAVLPRVANTGALRLGRDVLDLLGDGFARLGRSPSSSLTRLGHRSGR
jgi:hypothetical protein